MNRRNFFGRVAGALAALCGVRASPASVPELLADVAGPVFDLQSLPLPIVHTDFWISSKVLLLPKNGWEGIPEVYDK